MSGPQGDAAGKAGGARLELMLTGVAVRPCGSRGRILPPAPTGGAGRVVACLAPLAGHEPAERGRRRIRRHPGEARLLPGKSLSGFDPGAVKAIPKAQVMALAAGDARLARGACCLIFGPPGTDS